MNASDASSGKTENHTLADHGPGTAPEVRIRIAHLTKTFQRSGGAGKVIPVDDVSLDVIAGELLVLLGPSGCGKTTLLRCIAGLERPESGEISIQGAPVFMGSEQFVPPDRRPVSMIFQSYALWPHMTIYENVAYPLRSKKTPKDEIDERVRSTLEMVGLSELPNQYPGQISGGQQQRVALARALVADASVILFDEPLSNVDAKVRESLRLELLEMQRDLHFTGVYVTHDQSEALEVADRIAVLHSGRIEQLGTPRDIYRYPHSRYVAEFIGSANLWEGRVVERARNELTLDTPVGKVRVADAASESPVAREPTNDHLWVLTRPENLTISAAAPGGANRWEGRVVARTYLGPYTQFVVRCGPSEYVRVWMSRDSEIAEEDTVWLSAAPEDVRVLPAQYSVSHPDATPSE